MRSSKNKTTTSYNAIFKSDQEGYYEVTFPDFPGCVTFGKTMAEAKKKAKEVLQLWVEELTERGQRIISIPIELITGKSPSSTPRKEKTAYATAHC